MFIKASKGSSPKYRFKSFSDWLMIVDRFSERTRSMWTNDCLLTEDDMMGAYEDDIFKDFCREIIQHKEDTKNQRWKYKCDQLIDSVVYHPINLLSPRACISKVITESNSDIIELLVDLENAFYCLSQYAINLCREPDRPEYKLIKTYNGYYAANILSIMKGNDVPILKSMGYNVCDNCENEDEFELTHPSKHITQLAFQLFLAQPYCRLVQKICQQALDEKYPVDAIRNLLLDYEIGEILTQGVQKLCEQWLVKNKQPVPIDYRSNYENYPSYPSIVNETNINDDDLYGTQTDIENMNMNDYNEGGDGMQSRETSSVSLHLSASHHEKGSRTTSSGGSLSTTTQGVAPVVRSRNPPFEPSPGYKPPPGYTPSPGYSCQPTSSFGLLDESAFSDSAIRNTIASSGSESPRHKSRGIDRVTTQTQSPLTMDEYNNMAPPPSYAQSVACNGNQSRNASESKGSRNNTPTSEKDQIKYPKSYKSKLYTDD